MTAGDVGDDAAMRTVALAGIWSGKSMREIAVDLYGADQVAADWHDDSGMRAKVRRLVNRARAASDQGPDNGNTDPTGLVHNVQLHLVRFPLTGRTNTDAARNRRRSGFPSGHTGARGGKHLIPS